MPILNKLPDSKPYPHGLEWRILKQIPWAFVYSGLFVGLMTGIGHWLAPAGDSIEVNKYLEMVNIFAIASLITVWTAIFTIAIGAVIVYLMKGPAYVWDPMEVSDSDEPKP